MKRSVGMQIWVNLLILYICTFDTVSHKEGIWHSISPKVPEKTPHSGRGQVLRAPSPDSTWGQGCRLLPHHALSFCSRKVGCYLPAYSLEGTVALHLVRDQHVWPLKEGWPSTEGPHGWAYSCALCTVAMVEPSEPPSPPWGPPVQGLAPKAIRNLVLTWHCHVFTESQPGDLALTIIGPLLFSLYLSCMKT